jgi:predicted MFS family arabinose efflux permease
MVLAAGLAAAGEWPAPERRADVIAWTIVGQPAAWVAALPVIGRLAESGWRWTWVVVPLAAAAALIALPKGRADASPQASRKSSGRVWEVPGVRAWAFGELMAYAGWGGTLMYSGALLAESYGLSANTVALLLAAGAVTYFPGAFSARGQIDGDLRTLLGVLAALLAVGTAVFGLVRPAPAVSAALFAVLVLVAGARGVAGGAFGLTAAPEHKLAIGSIRSGVGQLGYLVGAAAGGLALTVGGWAAVGMVLALFFSAAAAPHLAPRLRARAAVPVPLAVRPRCRAEPVSALHVPGRQHDDLRLVRRGAELLADREPRDPDDLAAGLDDRDLLALLARDLVVHEDVLQRLRAVEPGRAHAVAVAPGADRQRTLEGLRRQQRVPARG